MLKKIKKILMTETSCGPVYMSIVSIEKNLWGQYFRQRLLLLKSVFIWPPGFSLSGGLSQLLYHLKIRLHQSECHWHDCKILRWNHPYRIRPWHRYFRLGKTPGLQNSQSGTGCSSHQLLESRIQFFWWFVKLEKCRRG